MSEFIKKALAGNGVQNDAIDVWVDVNGEQYTVPIRDVLDHDKHAFSPHLRG